MKKINLSDIELRALIGACYSALDTYRRCVRDLSDAAMPDIARTRLKAAFEQQIKDCRDVLDRLEEYQ